METDAQRDIHLVMYPLPEKLPLSEQLMSFLFVFMAVLSIVSTSVVVFLMTIGIGQAVFTAGMVSPNLIIEWPYVIALGALSLGVSILSGIASVHVFRSRNYFYRDVPQGKIVALTITGGSKTAVSHNLVVRGYNRMNELRTSVRAVKANQWFDGSLRIGQYVSFSKTEQK